MNWTDIIAYIILAAWVTFWLLMHIKKRIVEIEFEEKLKEKEKEVLLKKNKQQGGFPDAGHHDWWG